ncbi:uncharacterized protein LOC143219185 [Lasioglossum baleicum]|uniref:uncharacterized protein LOC143219185 n=1 Tax=Lasioglossum baleicum TaxID=434251 RepID=UPI003FCDAF71
MDPRNVDKRIKILDRRMERISWQLQVFEQFLEGFANSPDIIALNCRLQRLMDVFSTFSDVSTELNALKEDNPVRSVGISFDYAGRRKPTMPRWHVEDSMENRYIEAVITAKKLLSAADRRP